MPGMQPGMPVSWAGNAAFASRPQFPLLTSQATGAPSFVPFMGGAPMGGAPGFYPAMAPMMMPQGRAPAYMGAPASVVKPTTVTPQSQRKRRVARLEDDSGTVLNKEEIEAAAKEEAAKEAAAKEAAATPPAPH